MSGTITSLRFQKRTAERVNVYLDGEFAFAVPAIEAAKLRVGDFLDDVAVARLQVIDVRQKAYDRALRYLSFRPRSEAEVRHYLAENEFNAEVVEDVITRLSEHGYLNDNDFAQFWVENRQQFRPKGSAALRAELRQRGLNNDTINTALAGFDPQDGAYRAGRPYAVRLAGLAQSDQNLFRRKLGNFLLRRGFDYETVREVVARLCTEITESNNS